jgi:hypothetical protein
VWCSGLRVRNLVRDLRLPRGLSSFTSYIVYLGMDGWLSGRTGWKLWVGIGIFTITNKRTKQKRRGVLLYYTTLATTFSFLFSLLQLMLPAELSHITNDTLSSVELD